MQDLGSGVWQDAMSGMPGWDAFLVGEAFDWSDAFNYYNFA